MNNTVPVTAQLVEQRLEHRLTDAAAAASRQSHRYEALCGRRFIAASLAAPPGRPCPDCAVVLATHSGTATTPGRQSRRRRHGLLRRLLPTELIRRSPRPVNDAVEKLDQRVVTMEQAVQAIMNYFLANAEAGHHAANDALIAELARRRKTVS